MMGIVESVKGASDIYAPISGKVAAVNKTLEEKPSIINKDPLNLGSAMVLIFGSFCRVAVQDPDGRLERPWNPHGRGSIQDFLHRGRPLNVKIDKSSAQGLIGMLPTPRFFVRPQDVSLLAKPGDFLDFTVKSIRGSKRRILLSSLYIGCGKPDEQLLVPVAAAPRSV